MIRDCWYITLQTCPINTATHSVVRLGYFMATAKASFPLHGTARLNLICFGTRYFSLLRFPLHIVPPHCRRDSKLIITATLSEPAMTSSSTQHTRWILSSATKQRNICTLSVVHGMVLRAANFQTLGRVIKKIVVAFGGFVQDVPCPTSDNSSDDSL